MEMPSMEALHRRLKHRDFVMVAVAEEDDAAAVRAFVAEVGITFPVLLDAGATLSPRYGATGYPETFIIDRNGQVVNHTVGPAEWDTPEMIAFFERLLSPPDEGPESARR
jgi:peroxiredoxin